MSESRMATDALRRLKRERANGFGVYPSFLAAALTRSLVSSGMACARGCLLYTSNLQKEMEIKLAETGTRVTVTHRIRNLGEETTEMAPWALSVMVGGGRAILPFAPKAPFSPSRLLDVYKRQSSEGGSSRVEPESSKLLTKLPSRGATTRLKIDREATTLQGTGDLSLEHSVLRYFRT